MARTRANSAALLVESIARMSAGFVVAILLARQYGPHGLGLITTASASVTIVLGFSALGLSGVLVRELVDKYPSRGAILLTTTIAKLLAGAILLAALIGSLMLFAETPSLINLTLIMGLGYLFASLDTVDALYNARENFLRLVTLRLAGLGLATVQKILAIQLDWGLEFVALGYALDYGLMYLLPAVDFMLRRQGGFRDPDFRPRIDLAELRKLLRKSWPVLVSGGFAQINLRIDALMIAGLATISEVGIYSAASRLSEAWSVLAMAIVTATFPSLVKLSRTDVSAYAKELGSTLRALVWLALAGAVFISALSPLIINLLYGPEFASAATVLSIHVFGGVFLFIRTAVSRWLIIEDLLRFSLVSHALGAAINVALNLILIPMEGAVGAAWASVASYATSGVLFLLVSRRSRPMFFFVLWSALPFRFSHQAHDRLAHEMASRRQA